MTNRQLFAACAAAAIAIGTAMPAHAQDTSSSTTPPTEGGDVVITAQGRAQQLADVPVAVTAINSQALQDTGATDIRQLNQVAPSLLVSSTGSEANGSARIRGIGTVGDNPGLESSVAVFIDGVYRSRSGIGLNELGEIDRVEVLRGPQGTLGGRNASAGVISIFTKAPDFNGFSGMGEVTYGNYDFWRLQGALNVPLASNLAARVDGVFVSRDGFYSDPANNTKVNDRNRYFIRGQLLFEPNSDVTFRLIGDYTHRKEACCAAIYVDNTVNPLVGNLNDVASPLSVGGVPPADGNNIINVLRDLGQNVAAFKPGYNRTISTTPGRSFLGTTVDWGISGQLDWDFGGTKLTSITAYRHYRADQGGDIDYGTVDILYRDANGQSARQFNTFTQELRLQGKAFDGHLDWLVGGFFANEDLTVTDNLRFGNDYGRFATCRIVSGGGLAGLYSPTSPGCLAARPAIFGAASPAIYAGFDILDSINDKGSTLDRYYQNSRNWALFTHNIIHVTDSVDVTLGLRYTNERKRFNATFGNDNTACPAAQGLLSPFLSVSALQAVAGGLIALSCQGNATSELNGVSINDVRNESEFTGTGIVSWKPSREWLVYGSYSRGYKAGGFNLDRSALKSPIVSFASVGGAQALVGNLQFAPETVNAFELGVKFSNSKATITLAAFREQFSNFQLNTFNGSVFIVQNINGCTSDLGGADRDTSATTGACAASNVGYGVVSQGFEFQANLRPVRDVNFNVGLTYSDTKYRDNLVGNDTGAPLDPALRKLPGAALSNAPKIVATASLAWTPQIGGSGLSALFYVDTRMTSDYNTGSDLFPQKGQDGFVLVNGRVGIRGPEKKWALEFWAQNLFDTKYAQVAFNSPFQAGGSGAPFVDPQFPGGRQIFSMFLAEPRTYGVTLRTRF